MVLICSLRELVSSMLKYSTNNVFLKACSVPSQRTSRKHPTVQHPTSREIPSFKVQTSDKGLRREFETWNLDVLWMLDVERLNVFSISPAKSLFPL
jgi:hypothetical protein